MVYSYVHWHDNLYRIYRKEKDKDLVFVAQIQGRDNVDRIIKLLNLHSA